MITLEEITNLYRRVIQTVRDLLRFQDAPAINLPEPALAPFLLELDDFELNIPTINIEPLSLSVAFDPPALNNILMECFLKEQRARSVLPDPKIGAIFENVPQDLDRLRAEILRGRESNIFYATEQPGV